MYAVDGKTGEQLWQYDPKVPGPCRGEELLRRGEPRCGGLSRQGLCRHVRRSADRARCREGHARLERGDRRHRTRCTPSAVRRASAPASCSSAMAAASSAAAAMSAPTTPRPGELAWRFYTVPGDPAKARWRRIGRHHGESRAAHLVRSAQRLPRRRHGVELDRLRSGVRPGLSRDRQRLSVAAQAALRRQGRQPLHLLGGRTRCEDRQVQMALPGDARRQLGLRLRRRHDPRGPHDRRRSRARC